METRDVVIAGYLRTAQSRSRPNDPGRDWLHKLRADDMLGLLLPELLKRAGVEPKEVDDCISGCAQQVGENFLYGGRMPVFLANFPETVAAKAVDQQCGSAMAAIHMGYMEIAMGYSDITVAAGMEHMTRIPMGGGGAISPNFRLMQEEQYKHWDMMTTMNMGLTAEKLSHQIGSMTREQMDRWATRSHNLAEQARNDGFFDDEIMSIEAEQADGSTIVVDKDQAVREGATYEGVAQLNPAFQAPPDGDYFHGVITAGNSSPLNAAATSMLLMSKETAKKKGITPLATIRSIGFAGVDPSVMGVGPVPASKMALDQAGLDVNDIDFWEINEAFCVVALNCINELGIDADKVNVMGGATALGHPLGATGVRLVGTLARILNVKNARYGCANACVGGGQGVATVIEREEY